MRDNASELIHYVIDLERKTESSALGKPEISTGVC
jgi:hypothetical protein